IFFEIVKRGFYYVDVQDVAFGRLVFLNRVQRLPASDDDLIVPLIFGGELGREEIGVCFVDNVFFSSSDSFTETAIDESEDTLHVLSKDILREAFDERMIECL